MPAKGEPKTPMGHTIRRLREAARISGKELGDKAGLTQSRVSELELGQYAPKLDEVEALEQAFGLPRGGLLIEAGWLTLPTTAIDLIRVDPELSPGWRKIVAGAYRTGIEGSRDEGWDGARPKPKRRQRAAG